MTIGQCSGTDLDHAECLRLLSSTTIGRLVHTRDALPVVEPVRFVLDGDTAVFRSAYARLMASQGADPVVAFQADDLDPATGAGWTVMAIGRARILSPTEAAAYCPTRLRSLTHAASTLHVVAMDLDLLTGMTVIG